MTNKFKMILAIIILIGLIVPVFYIDSKLDNARETIAELTLQNEKLNVEVKFLRGHDKPMIVHIEGDYPTIYTTPETFDVAVQDINRTKVTKNPKK